MILKDKEDIQRDIAVLESLIDHPQVDPARRRAIEIEMRNIRAGATGEADAAYQIKVHFGPSRNWLVIHDLRIEHDGLVAQIDHLLINRFLEFWICESKRVANGVKINDHGEFITFRERIPQGMDSPIEQNIRHIKILGKALAAADVHWPTRLGMTLKPDVKSLVLISRGSIDRPKVPIPGLETVIKTDQLWSTIDRRIDEANALRLVARLVGRETLESLGRQIVALHRPITFDWARRFGLEPVARAEPPGPIAPVPYGVTTVAGLPIARKPEQSVMATPIALPASQQPTCATCGVAVSPGVARFCARSKTRFAGQTYCMKCQPEVRTATA